MDPNYRVIPRRDSMFVLKEIYNSYLLLLQRTFLCSFPLVARFDPEPCNSWCWWGGSGAWFCHPKDRYSNPWGGGIYPLEYTVMPSEHK